MGYHVYYCVELQYSGYRRARRYWAIMFITVLSCNTVGIGELEGYWAIMFITVLSCNTVGIGELEGIGISCLLVC